MLQAAAPPSRETKQSSRNNPVGSLVIVGGGYLPDSIRDRFLELAGGKNARLVIIPTANKKADDLESLVSFPYWKSQKVASVVFLHTRKSEEANDPKFVKPLTEATGVWFIGGDQSQLVAPYRGTLVERELRRLLARGGVIGGTSAGASAMSALMIVGGNPMAQIGTGFGLLPAVVIDQHFQNRNRLARLLGILARHPQYLGLGIDEQTAVVVRAGRATVLGNADVRLCTHDSDKGKPEVRVFKTGQQIDLNALYREVVARTAPMSKDKAVSTTSQPNTTP